MTPIISDCLLFHTDGILDDVTNATFSRVTSPLWGKSIGWFTSQRPVMRRFDVFFFDGLRLNKRLSKQSRRRLLETYCRIFFIFFNFNFQLIMCWQTDKQTYRQTDIQKDRHEDEWIHNKCIYLCLSTKDQAFKTAVWNVLHYIYDIYACVCVVCPACHTTFDYKSVAMMNLLNYESISRSLLYHVIAWNWSVK